VPAFAPVLFNLAVIGVCNQWVLPYFGEKPEERIWVVAYAVLAGGLLQLLVMIPPALARGFKFDKGPAIEDEGYTEVMNGFKAVALLVTVFQVNVLLDNIIAEVLVPGDGPVTYLNMGTSVYQFAWAVISLAIGTVALPAMSKLWAQNKPLEFESTLRQALRLSFFFAVPATVGIALLSEEVVRLLYGSGKFLENDGEPIRRTAAVALYSSMGLVFFSLNAIYARALYAMKDMRTPTVTSAWSVAINVVLNLVFVLATPLQESGIALASAISSAWQTWALAQAVRTKMNAVPEASQGSVGRDQVHAYMRILVGAALASLAAGSVAYRFFVSKKDWTGWLAILNEGFIAFFAAIIASLILFSFIMRQYFSNKLKDAPLEADLSLYRYGRKEEHWSDALRFQFSLYATVLSSAVMGFVVWATRDSLPPEGNLLAVLQRAIAPVLVGLIAYYFATSGMHSPDYQELLNVLRRKKKSTDAEKPKP
jgi:murein biosynthesis integral membrane protein MurJ